MCRHGNIYRKQYPIQYCFRCNDVRRSWPTWRSIQFRTFCKLKTKKHWINIDARCWQMMMTALYAVKIPSERVSSEYFFIAVRSSKYHLFIMYRIRVFFLREIKLKLLGRCVYLHSKWNLVEACAVQLTETIPLNRADTPPTGLVALRIGHAIQLSINNHSMRLSEMPTRVH